jgi:Tol biopolymer transport system component
MFVGAFSLDVSPNGQSIVVGTTDDRNNYAALVCDLPRCENRRRVAAVPPGRLRWTPDGQGIAYISRTLPSNVWIQPLDGSAPHALTTFSDRVITDFAWSRDGSRLAVARGAVTNDIVLFKGLKR